MRSPCGQAAGRASSSHDLLEAALARPYSGYYRPIARKAAAILDAVACRHAFTDGNKRTAILLVTVLLERSRYKLHNDDLNREVEEMVIDVVEHRLSFDQLVRWFQRRIVAA